MRERLPWILFFVSLALNLSVLIGVLWVGHDQLLGKADLMASTAETLELSPPERDGLVNLRGLVTERLTGLEGQSGSWSDFSLGVLQRPDFQPDAVRQAMVDRSAQRREVSLEIMQRLHAWLYGLEPEKRARFLALVSADRDFLRNLVFRPDRT